MNNLNGFKRSTPGIYRGGSFNVSAQRASLPDTGKRLRPALSIEGLNDGVTHQQQIMTNHHVRHNITIRPSNISDYDDLQQCYLFAAPSNASDSRYINADALVDMAYKADSINRGINRLQKGEEDIPPEELTRIKLNLKRENAPRYRKDKELTTVLTLPLLNYYLHHMARLRKKNGEPPLTITDVYRLVRPMGVCITQQEEREQNDRKPDVRGLILSGTVDTHNLWDYGARIQDNVYFVIVPKKVDRLSYNYDLSSTGDTRSINYMDVNGNDVPEYYFEVVPMLTTDGRHPDCNEYFKTIDIGGRDELIEGGFWYIGIIYEPTKAFYKDLRMKKGFCQSMKVIKDNPTAMLMLTQPVSHRGMCF